MHRHESKVLNVDCIVTTRNLRIPLILTIGTLSKPHGRSLAQQPMDQICGFKKRNTLKNSTNTSEIRFMPRHTHTLTSVRDQPCVEDRLVLDAAWPAELLKYGSDNEKQYENFI